MSVDVCHDAWKRVACLYDNTTDTAFGPIFTGIGAGTEAEDFLDWLREKVLPGIKVAHNVVTADPRAIHETQMRSLVDEWRRGYNPSEIEPQSLRVPDDYEEGRVQT